MHRAYHPFNVIKTVIFISMQMLARQIFRHENKMPECIREREISKLPHSKRWKANIARGLVYQIKK